MMMLMMVNDANDDCDGGCWRSLMMIMMTMIDDYDGRRWRLNVVVVKLDDDWGWWLTMMNGDDEVCR